MGLYHGWRSSRRGNTRTSMLLAKVTFNGLNVHPGYAKGKMINSILIANKYIAMLPADETPAETEGYEGFTICLP